MAGLERWNDYRLDDLDERVGELRDVPVQLAELKGAIKGLTRDIRDPNGNVAQLSRRLDSVMGDPIAERRARMTAIRVAVIGAVVGGVIAIIGAVVAGLIG